MNDEPTTAPAEMYHPAPRMSFITEAEQEMVPILRTELRHFAAEVVRVARNPVEAAGAWAYTFLGIGISAGLSLITLISVEGNKVASGVLAAHAAVLAAALFLAGFLAWLDRKITKDVVTNAEELADRILEVDRRAPTQDPQTAQG